MAGAGQRGGGSPFPWPNQDNLGEDLAAGGCAGGIPVPRRIPPGSQAGEELSEPGWDGGASEKQPKQSADPKIKKQKD